MKMYMIIYDASFDEDVTDTLTSCCITGFTKWRRVLGRGERSDPKMDDAVWPGYNSTIMMAVDIPEEPEVTEALKGLYGRMGSMGLRLYSWPIEKIL